ncbi:hypothetical protein K458DRAFT_152221 [Lentithecium fluviatile CBS 122367]|uniref:Uncharacterized protein n=1 Tax=Lentithecium fluviatile CBS 122367 TaxID=1168545 RepID=A0A6G1JF38_9PLEO|nr:hypothetical protein K458DRAFT_152221 [Lentithecium fluviatile CBS 122367]
MLCLHRQAKSAALSATACIERCSGNVSRGRAHRSGQPGHAASASPALPFAAHGTTAHNIGASSLDSGPSTIHFNSSTTIQQSRRLHLHSTYGFGPDFELIMLRKCTIRPRASPIIPDQSSHHRPDETSPRPAAFTNNSPRAKMCQDALNSEKNTYIRILLFNNHALITHRAFFVRRISILQRIRCPR